MDACTRSYRLPGAADDDGRGRGGRASRAPAPARIGVGTGFCTSDIVCGGAVLEVFAHGAKA